MPRATIPLTLLLALLSAATTRAAEPDPSALDRRFADQVRPFLTAYCLKCHGPEKPKAKLDLSGATTAASVARDFRVWDRVVERLEAEEMPPEAAPRQPSPDDRRAVVAWLQEFRASEARRNAGDPGPVLARRLSNAEYDYTIRDLTGVDLRPAREFPVDPANEAGFDNSGAALAMSPALVEKYLAAARRVAEHLVLLPSGFTFAPGAAVTDTDRDKFCVQRILAFYQRQRVDLADYLWAAWRYQHRAALGQPDAALGDMAIGLSARYLATVWAALNGPQIGPLAEVQAQFREFPGADQLDEARKGCERLRDRIISLRHTFEPRVGKLRINGVSPGSQPLVLWRDRQLAERRLRTSEAGDAPASAEFCRVFPDAFYLADRAPYFENKPGGSGRPLTAGFHLMQGYFRDDAPLYELVLDDAGRREIDRLWQELDFVAYAPLRQYKDFIFFERAEPPRFMQEAAFDFARSEDKDSASPAKIEQLRVAYLAKVRKAGATTEAIDAVARYFAEIASAIRTVEKSRLAAEQSHLHALLAFNERAYRRPLSQAEKDDLLAFYRELREKEGLDHEEALRDTIASILMSPHFCYRIDPPEPGTVARPVSGPALASRLSYFLWSSMPDAELLTHAASGNLSQPEVLRAQTRRMLRDDRVRALALEFAGNWLDCRRFEEHNSVDRARFPSFTNALRQAMFEEPIRFFEDVARRDRSVIDFLDGTDTFVNPVLAAHYGIPVDGLRADEWVHIADARPQGRGGLLPMAVFLTKNAPGLRTSPVKRGYWVVRRVLGETIPAPPPGVPELPKDEAALGELTLPQLLARHRASKSCASCHERFDAIGLTFEGYGPIGERRDRDLGGRPIDARVTFPDGSIDEGLNGLRRYVNARRRDEFLDNLDRKLLAYALGRDVMPSDESTLATMRAAEGQRFGGLVEAIVTSPQFLNQRGRDDPRN